MKMTDEELLAVLADPADDPARMERISTEIDAGFSLLSHRLGKAVAVFGSARPGPQDPRYAVARTPDGRVITDESQAAPGDRLDLILRQGKLAVKVEPK